MKIKHKQAIIFLTFLAMLNLLSFDLKAAELDEKTGKLKADHSGLLFGFEQDESLPPIVIFDAAGDELATSASQNAVIEDEMGIEGKRRFEFSSIWFEARIKLLSLAENLDGRRIEVRLWTQPQGIKVNAQLAWEINGVELSAIHFNPTGRVTDDGWQELTSGPLDYNLVEGVSLSTLKIVNDQLEYPFRGQTIDPKYSNLIDAIEIIDLGEAEVNRSQCRAPTEKEQCGAQGSCFIGRCVDSAFLWGAKPNPSIAAQAIDHRVYQVEIAEGVRKSHQAFEVFKQAMDDVKASSDGQQFWQGQQDALQMLEDGHLETPKAAVPNIPNVGFCINTGEADLIPDDQLPGNQPNILPMVFNNVTLVNGVMLKAGDVISKIDGLEPQQWVNQVRSPYFIAPGDVNSRLVMQYHYLNHLIGQSGALVEFKRCEINGGCLAEQVNTFNVDFSQLMVDSYWNGEFAPWMFENGFCDFRFDEGAPLKISDGEFSQQVTTQKREEITEIQFNGYHRPNSNPEWHASFEGALSDSPNKVLIDHRFGVGGSPAGLHYILDNFIGQEDYKKVATMSWHGTQDETSQVNSALNCNIVLTSIYECGWVWSFKQGDYIVESSTQKSKLALVNGWGVSASDFFMRTLQERKAETRVFGISVMPGGYGTTAFLPNLLNEYRTGRLQIQDGMFEFKQWTDFESGYGAVPDEFVFQKQSDAIRGVDTIIVAAKSWLQTTSDGE